MNPDGADDQHERGVNASGSTPDNHDTIRRDLARLSLSQNSPGTEDHRTNSTKSDEDEEQEHNKPGPSGASERPRIYRINTLNKDGESVDDEGEDEEGSNIRPDQLFDIVFNLDTPREVDLKVSIKGDFNVTIL
ncbi:hypothetical protein BJX64DRAFT_259252 [Aspergillus heterothallicus]